MVPNKRLGWLSTTGAMLAALLLAPSAARARLNPLRVVTERQVKAEIVLVLDTSSSMSQQVSPPVHAGNDCGGDRAGTFDLCGDGLCSGNEGSPENLCPEDCNIFSHYTPTAGSPPLCDPGNVAPSRMFIVKRVLSNLLPQISKAASLGLVTFKQFGYFQYYPATAGPTKKVTVFLSQLEMAAAGAWDLANKGPSSSFVRNGTTYTLLSLAGLPQTADSLYSRNDDPAKELRASWADVGESTSDGTYGYSYKGSFYTYAARSVDFTSPQVITKFMGPQYTDSYGNVWVYHRFNNEGTAQGIMGNPSGMVAEALPATSGQGDVDGVTARILSRLNFANNGGLWAMGGTPSGPSIQAAETLYHQRQAGIGEYSGTPPDPQASCRPRFVLLMTDGTSNQGVKPYTAAKGLYGNPQFSDNPIKTLVVGLPGLPQSAVTELDRTADVGDDGLENKSASALLANDEAQLYQVLQEVFFNLLQGDYATTSPGLNTSGTSGLANDQALLPSTDYPGWQGHLRNIDLTQEPQVVNWDAAELLNAMDYTRRKLFTGYPDSNAGAPVPLLTADGQVNVAAVRQVWSQAGTPPADGEIVSVVEWLAGKDRPWRLGPIFRSTPAVVGPPPVYNVQGHALYRAQQRYRERLIYIASNEGLLHAFRAADGSEAFAYLPPNLLPALHKLWRSGGQSADPSRFRWLLASSPRVEDIPPPEAPLSWRTHLALVMGPGDRHFVVLDITDPSSCSGSTCTLKESPFFVVAHSDSYNLSSYMGNTWSTPVFYYQVDNGGLQAKLAMGSGYGTGDAGNYYNRFADFYTQHSAAAQSGAGALVDYGLVADTSAAIQTDGGRQVVASYQGDPSGEMVRYAAGNPAYSSPVISGGGLNPFYFSPAISVRDGDNVLLAANSGSVDEEEPAAGAETTLYLRSETEGEVDPLQDHMSCKVSQLCSGGPGCPSAVPLNCTAPGPTAVPTSPPLLVRNRLGATTQSEAFYLLYEQPTAACSTGDTWLVRVATDGAQQRLISATRYENVRATGMSVVGGGIDLAISRIGRGEDPASVFTLADQISDPSASSPEPYIETWREVR